MTEWHFWGEKRFADVYENIYIRTFMEDWFKIVKYISNELIDHKEIIDIGCGEGHTTKQILDRIESKYGCDLLEPDKAALANGEAFLFSENDIKNCYVKTLDLFEPKKKYDAAYTIHTNYYWAFNEKGFNKHLDKLMNMIKKDGKVMILTLPEESDHYNVMIKQVYPKFNYSKYMIYYYKQKGFDVKVKRFKMRMYVGDILSTKKIFELKSFYRFIHNTNIYPSDSDAKKFLSKIKKFQHNDCLDFKDDLIIVTNKK
ncbi:MAG: class I SAM-dependent methyltransferase [Nanoarchaeota archaeon]|nr:class I SAM-dependent methyltransferase [Nanoarchaeota archaeon]